MNQSGGWKSVGKSDRIVVQDPIKAEVEKRMKNAKGFKPVIIRGKPMEIKEEISLKGDLYFVIVLQREEPLPKQ